MLTAHPIQIDQHRAVAWRSPTVTAAPRPTVVLLHGFPMDHHLWDDVADRLQRVARVVAVDLPGFGRSQPIGPILAMDAAADFLVRGLPGWGVDGKIVLVGLSMGGYVALEFAAAYPQRLSRLVLCNTKSEADSEAARLKRLEMAEQLTADHALIDALAKSMPEALLGSSTWQRRPAVGQRLAEMIRRSEPAAVAAAQRGMAQRRDHTETVRRLPVDVLCISGQEDALTGPEVMRPIAETAPQGRLEVLPAAGHVTPMEAPDAWAAAVVPFVADAASA